MVMINKIFKLFDKEKDYIDEFNDMCQSRIKWMDIETLRLYTITYLTIKNKSCRDCEIEAALIQLDLDEFGSVCVKKRVNDFMKFYKEATK